MSSTESYSFPDIPAVPNGGYKTIVADPAWMYDDDLPGGGRGAESHYDVLHHKTMAGMGPQIRKISASHSHLYLWTTNSFVEKAYEIAKAWNFDPKTMITWVKVNDEPETLPYERDEPVELSSRIGMGHYFRNNTEHLIFATKGRKKTNRNDVPTAFFAERDKHSAKPEKSYRLIEELSDGPRLEMFSRKSRDGWDVWGDEV